MSTRPRCVVVGGGIAGLSVGLALACDRDVVVLEREPALGTHSSARNAQIWLPSDDDASTGPLAQRSAERLSALVGSEDGWLRRQPAIVLTDPSADPTPIRRGAERGAMTVHALSVDELRAKSPIVEGDVRAYEIMGAGLFDPHVMITALARACREAGVALRVGEGVAAIDADRSVRAVRTERGERIACDEIVLAAGAWAGALGRAIGLDIPLVPLRRHLVLLDADPRAAGTTVWRFGEPAVYWRPESGGVLASPCDEEPFDACLPPSDPRALERLAEALEPVAPRLVDAPVRTSWACLRTYAHDRELVLGPDPRVDGLAWLAGFGGRGMTIAVAAGELCAEAMRGRGAPIAQPMRPDREQPTTLRPPD